MLKKLIYGTISLAIIFGITGCASNDTRIHDLNQEAAETFSGPMGVKAAENIKLHKMVALIDTNGKKVGKATFTQMKHGVLLKIFVEGMKPGRHGFHLHETGKCETPSFESSGGHFNPTAKKHGFNNPQGYHAGDIANLVVDKNGVGMGEFHLDTVTLEEGKVNSLLDSDGSALLIHSGADDYSTDPAGNSGKRVACGVIVE